MRFIFVKELIKYAKKNKNVYLVTADLGYRAFEEFKRLYPESTGRYVWRKIITKY